MGLGNFAPPDGGFYLYIDISHLTDDSEQWCDQLLHDTGVAIAPGVDFDPIDGRKYVRISFCVSLETIRAACDRLRQWLG